MLFVFSEQLFAGTLLFHALLKRFQESVAKSWDLLRLFLLGSSVLDDALLVTLPLLHNRLLSLHLKNLCLVWAIPVRGQVELCQVGGPFGWPDFMLVPVVLSAAV